MAKFKISAQENHALYGIVQFLSSQVKVASQKDTDLKVKELKRYPSGCFVNTFFLTYMAVLTKLMNRR